MSPRPRPRHGRSLPTREPGYGDVRAGPPDAGQIRTCHPPCVARAQPATQDPGGTSGNSTYQSLGSTVSWAVADALCANNITATTMTPTTLETIRDCFMVKTFARASRGGARSSSFSAPLRHPLLDDRKHTWLSASATKPAPESADGLLRRGDLLQAAPQVKEMAVGICNSY